MELEFATRCIYGKKEIFEKESTGAISFPIYQTATYAHPEVGESTGFDYSRLQNPTRQQLEKVVASLEKGVDALAFSSGMAAITALMEIFKPGDHIITDADLYGGSIRLFDNISEKNGLTFSHIDCSKEDIAHFVNDKTKAIYIETPTNPMMNVVDIRKTAEIAKAYNLLLIVDNTFLSPYYPGIQGTKAHEICKSQARGFGAMITFEVENSHLAKHIRKHTKLIPFAESLGGVETLLTYPCTQTHADVPEEVRLANGITDSVLRLSAGIEDSKDLIADLKYAIDSYDGYKALYI